MIKSAIPSVVCTERKTKIMVQISQRKDITVQTSGLLAIRNFCLALSESIINLRGYGSQLR